VISTLSYNGGTWNLAMRMISTAGGREARRSMLFSGALYLVWPLVLFLPMWAAPILLPHLADPEQSYAQLATTLLPTGLVGLVLAGMFSHTMAMTSSDSNAIASVVVRDIIPVFRKGRTFLPATIELWFGRLITFLFITLSMVIALASDSFGGVLGLIILWFGALVGPVAVPMLLGMLPWFRRSGSSAALLSTAAGLIMFALNKYAWPGWIEGMGDYGQAWTIATPVVISILLFIVIGTVKPENTERTDALVDSLAHDGPVTDQRDVRAGIDA
jgi:SSS family solute:Na+ symporter